MSEQPDAPARDAGGAAQPRSGLEPPLPMSPLAAGAPSPAAPGGPPVSERMQALLSRAVEDQLSEQRQLASLVAEVRALMAALPGEVSAAAPVDEALRGEVYQLRVALTSVEHRLAVLTAAAEQPADHSPVTGVVNAVGSRVDGIGSAIAEVHAAQAGLQSQLHDVTAAVAALVRSQAETEQRLIAHVDEAVLALAEVLVRRGKPTGRPAPSVAPVTPDTASAEAPSPDVVSPEVAQPPPAEDETARVERHLAEDAPDDDSDDAAHSTDDTAEIAVGDSGDDEATELDPSALEDSDAEALAVAPPVEASSWGTGLRQGPPAEADDIPPPPPAPAADPWVAPSPFHPGPRRERGDSGASAALAELQDDGADELDAEDSDDSDGRARRRPWWRPGD